MITLLSLFLRRLLAGERLNSNLASGLYRLTINGLDMDATKQSVSRNGKRFPDPQKFLLLWLLASGRENCAPNRDRQRSLGN